MIGCALLSPLLSVASGLVAGHVVRSPQDASSMLVRRSPRMPPHESRHVRVLTVMSCVMS